MNISVSAETGMLDLPAFLLGEVYGPMQEEGKHISWTIEDSISLSEDLKNHYGIFADPKEIYDTMLEFDAQDNLL